MSECNQSLYLQIFPALKSKTLKMNCAIQINKKSPQPPVEPIYRQMSRSLPLRKQKKQQFKSVQETKLQTLDEYLQINRPQEQAFYMVQKQMKAPNIPLSFQLLIEKMRKCNDLNSSYQQIKGRTLSRKYCSVASKKLKKQFSTII